MEGRMINVQGGRERLERILQGQNRSCGAGGNYWRLEVDGIIICVGMRSDSTMCLAKERPISCYRLAWACGQAV